MGLSQCRQIGIKCSLTVIDCAVSGEMHEEFPYLTKTCPFITAIKNDTGGEGECLQGSKCLVRKLFSSLEEKHTREIERERVRKLYWRDPTRGLSVNRGG